MNKYPATWGLEKLGNLTKKIGSGATPKGGETAYKISGVPLVRSMNVVFFGFKRTGLAFIDQDQAKALDSAVIEAGDILLNITGASIGRVTRAPADLGGARVNQHVCIVRPLQGLDARFLNAYISAPAMQSQIWADNYGVTRQALTKQQIVEFDIPVPPLAEQTRIADKLDTVLTRVDACRDRLARVASLLKRFRQSVLAAATSGRLTEDWRSTNAPEWLWRDVVLSDIANIQGGVTKDAGKQSASDEEVPYLRVANVQRCYLDLNDIRTIRVPPLKLESLLLKPGDILFNEGGDLDKLGRGWIWEGQIARCSFQNHVFRARLFDLNCHPKYISWWGNTQGLEYFVQNGKQTTNLASINKTMLKNLPISLPPLAEQTEIVRRVETLFAFADRLEARLKTAQTAADRLTPALLAKAFRGELVPQDPNDEPAAELLKRLAASRDAAPKAKRGRRSATADTTP
jgi:type I restriction enzyme S subunit